MITKNFTLTVDGNTYNAFSDLNWILGNSATCIGDPVKYSNKVTVPFGKTYDAADFLFGYPFFESRVITLKIGVKGNNDWSNYKTTIRNQFEGKQVKLIFADDTSYYWTGTARIENFSASRFVAEFDFVIDADAYKYSVTEYSQLITSLGTTSFTNPSPQPTPIYISVTTLTPTNLQWTKGSQTEDYRLHGNAYYTDFEVPWLYNSPITPSLTITSGSWDSDEITIKYRLRSL